MITTYPLFSMVSPQRFPMYPQMAAADLQNRTHLLRIPSCTCRSHDTGMLTLQNMRSNEVAITIIRTIIMCRSVRRTKAQRIGTLRVCALGTLAPSRQPLKLVLCHFLRLLRDFDASFRRLVVWVIRNMQN